MAAKEYYGIDCIGSFHFQRVTSLPAWSSSCAGRALYDTATKKYYFGGDNRWIMFGDDLYDNPVFPQILTGIHRLSITKLTDRIVIEPNDRFLFRGIAKFDTADFSEAERTFTILPNKTYHLRFVFDTSNNRQNANFGAAFYAAKGIGAAQFYLIDVTDTNSPNSYNPEGLPETAGHFDSRLDDMLVARIVNDPSEGIVVTPLKNVVHYAQNFVYSSAGPFSFISGTGKWSYTHDEEVIDLARTPNYAVSGHLSRDNSGGDIDDAVNVIKVVKPVSRYGFQYMIETHWWNDPAPQTTGDAKIRVLMMLP